MDPATALALACNVMQLISVAYDTISLCKRLHRDGQLDPELTHRASHLSTLSTNLQTSIEDAVKQSGSLSPQEKELQTIANECYQASTALQAELAKLTNPKVGNHRAAFKATWKNILSKREIGKLENTLITSQRLLETKLLERLYINLINTNRNIESLDKESKHFIAQYQKGHRQLAQLIQDQGESVKTHVTRESQNLRQDLVGKLDEFKLTDTNQALEQRILDSLKDRDSNLRRNQITESHKGTFGWVFEKTTTNPWDGFVEWLESDSRLYWINGKPASGKSTLMKFLINETRTQDALNRWHPECMILSAFLWKSGQQIQRTRTGLLSSLIRQLLSARTSAIMGLISIHPSVANKTSLSDWSVVDLTVVLTDLLIRSDKYVCIFIDGLDEIGPEDDAHDLIKLVTTIKDQPKVKLCVSSRPERPFQRAFSASSKLRLQDLTAPDIKLHVTDFLQFHSNLIATNEYPNDAIQWLADIITAEADGVFLWVELVLRSVRTGMINGDRWAEMLQRLRLLPRNLDELYNQMWLRLNDDEPIYRQEAALYFNAVIDPKGFMIDRNMDYYNNAMVLTMALGANPTTLSTILDSRLYVAPEVIVKLCLQTANRIEVRSAGLLELSVDDMSEDDMSEDDMSVDDMSVDDMSIDDMSTDENGSSDNSVEIAHVMSELPKKTTRDQLDVLLGLRVSFIHRTVHDFLLETEQGRELLRHDEINSNARTIRYLRGLAAGGVALNSSLTGGVYAPELKYFLDVLRGLQDFVWNSREGNRQRREFVSSSSEENLQRKEFADLLLDLFDNNALTTESEGFDLLGLMASYGFDDVVVPALVKLEENGTLSTDYCNYLLCCASDCNTGCREDQMFASGDITVAGLPSMFGAKMIIEWLVRRGANPNGNFPWHMSSLCEQTPFMILLCEGINELSKRNYMEEQTLHQHYDWFVGIVRSFIDAGANLDSVCYSFYQEESASSSISYRSDEDEPLVPVFLSGKNAASMIGEALDIFHNTDSQLSNILDNEKLTAAKEFKRVELAAVLQLHAFEDGIIHDIDKKTVVISEEDSLTLADLFKGDWRDHPSGRNPFEEAYFEGILQRGRQVDLWDYMEKTGVVLRGVHEQEEFPPRIPGQPPRKKYKVLDADSQEEYPLHTWFRDRSPKEHLK